MNKLCCSHIFHLFKKKTKFSINWYEKISKIKDFRFKNSKVRNDMRNISPFVYERGKVCACVCACVWKPVLLFVGKEYVIIKRLSEQFQEGWEARWEEGFFTLNNFE